MKTRVVLITEYPGIMGPGVTGGGGGRVTGPLRGPGPHKATINNNQPTVISTK